MAPCKEIPVNRDPPTTETPLPANAAATGSQQIPQMLLTTNPGSGSQIPSVTLTYDAFQQIIDGIVRNQGAHSSAPSSQSAAVDNVNYAHDFISFDPPAFDGSSHDIDVAYEWIRDLESIFDLLKFQDEQRVRSAVFRLKGHARNWWKSVGPTQDDDLESHISWQEFKDMFLDWYCPETIRKEKEMEFVNLRQGTMTVFDYENQFLKLSRFAPELLDTPTPSKMAHRFVRGLRKEIKGIVAMQNHKDLLSASQSARVLEECVPARCEPGQDHESCSCGRKKRKHQRIAWGSYSCLDAITYYCKL